MSQATSTHYSKHTKAHDDFLSRFRKNLIKELVIVTKIMRMTFGIIFAVIFGVTLFLAELDFIRKIFAITFLPVLIFLIGRYLTLLPMYLVIGAAIVSILSISFSEEGSNFVTWLSGILGSLSEGFGGPSSSPASASVRLLGFMIFSAVASFFIVFLI